MRLKWDKKNPHTLVGYPRKYVATGIITLFSTKIWNASGDKTFASSRKCYWLNGNGHKIEGYLIDIMPRPHQNGTNLKGSHALWEVLEPGEVTVPVREYVTIERWKRNILKGSSTTVRATVISWLCLVTVLICISVLVVALYVILSPGRFLTTTTTTNYKLTFICDKITSCYIWAYKTCMNIIVPSQWLFSAHPR